MNEPMFTLEEIPHGARRAFAVPTSESEDTRAAGTNRRSIRAALRAGAAGFRKRLSPVA